jgi:hypothetical protein
MAKKKPAKTTKTTRPVDTKPRKRKYTEEEAYERHKERTATRQRVASAGKREIGPLPAVADPERRAECEQDLQLALETYFPDVFALGWSHQHIEVIDALQTSLRDGGLFALGMPRGSGKTSLCVHAVILAMLYGWRNFLVLIGATAAAAYEMMDTFKMQLESNDRLLEDFPEVCYPVRCLEGIPNRAKGQTVGGEQTRISWSGRKETIFPTIAGSKSSGSIIRAVSLLGRVRGMNYVTSEGKSLRPNAFIGDDLQTDASAKKVEQVEKREGLLNGAVLGLAGPGKRIAGLVTVTIVRKGDLADRLLDRKLNPHFHGRTYSLVERWPDAPAVEHWEHYAELREIDLAEGHDTLPKATKYYRQHRNIMDTGAVVPWSQRREPHELSALQNAYNLKLSKPATFDAEYQNNPQLSNTAIGQVACPESDQLVQRVNGYKRREIPRAASHLFASIDVQQDVLFYQLVAMAEDFSGWIIDYGSWPEQPIGNYWTLSDVQYTTKMVTKIGDLEGSIYEGLDRLTKQLAAMKLTRDDGATMAVDRFIIDANWGPSTSTVYSFCRQSALNPLPFHGKGISAKQQPIAARKKKPGERGGEFWYQPSVRGTNTPRHVICDTNAIKTILAQRLTIPIGSRGAWSLFQNSIAGHRMIADQLSAEYPIETEGRGRKLYEWSLIPGRDNHWLDCAVMICTLALMHGCAPGQRLASPSAAQQQKSLAELRAEAMARRKSTRVGV